MSDFIRYYDDVLTKEQCQVFIDETKLLLKDCNEEWTVVGVKHSKGNRDLFRLESRLYQEQRFFIDKTIEEIYNKYKNEFTLDQDYSTITFNWKVHYTPVGGYIDWHNDLGGKNDEAWKRKIVFIIYLNDLDEGELKFKHFDTQIMPRAGRVLVMPTGWVWEHKADKLFEEKYIITGFFYDKEDKC